MLNSVIVNTALATMVPKNTCKVVNNEDMLLKREINQRH